MTEATNLILTSFACSKSALLANIPSIRSIIIMELNDTSFTALSKTCRSKMYTKFRHCKTSCSSVGFSDGFEDPDGHLGMQERTKRSLRLLFHSHYLTAATIRGWEIQAGF